MQGGLEAAQFDLRQPYESILDLVAGNWVVWACLGGFTATSASSGATSILVGGLPNVQTPAFDDLILNDTFVITDGVNTEMFSVASKTSAGGGNYTIGLGGCYANVQVATLATLNADAASGATSVTVYSASNLSNGQSIVINGQKVTIGTISGQTVPISPDLTNAVSAGTGISDCCVGATSFTVTSAAGLSNGMSLTIDDGLGASATNPTGSYSDTKTITGITGNKVSFTGGLTNSHGAGAPVVFQMTNKLKNSYGLGAIVARLQYQGYLTQRIHSTQRPNQMSLEATGFFSRYGSLIGNSEAQGVDGGEIMLADVSSYAATLPGVIIRSANCASPVGTNVNISATDQTVSEIMATILRQENGSNDNAQYTVYIGPDRQLYHQSVQTVPSFGDNASTTLTANSAINATTFNLASVSHFKKGRQIVITTGSNVDTLTISSVSSKAKTVTTTVGATYAHNSGDSCVVSFGVTPTVALTLSDQSGAYGDTIGSLQTTDMDITNLMNCAVVTGTTDSSQVSGTNEFTTNLSASTLAGATVFTVNNPSIFSNGSPVQIGAFSSATRDKLTVASVGSNSITTTTGSVNAHTMGEQVEMATTLSANCAQGATTFSVSNDIFSSGQEISISPAGTDAENLTIASTAPGSITTTTACKAAHNTGATVALSSTGAGSSPRILMEQQDSIADFGYFEGTLTSEDIWDESTLAQWAAQQLAISAWPVLKSQLTLNTASGRINGRDLVQVSGFSDGSALVQNVVSIQYTAVAADQNLSATGTLGILASTARRTIKEISKEHPRKHRRHAPGVPRKNHNMVINGCDFTQTGANTFTISAGTVEYRGAIYQMPSFSDTAVEGTSEYGAQCMGSIGITKMPKRTWNNRDVYGNSVYTIDSAGNSPTLQKKFYGLPLWKVACKGGTITGYFPLTSDRGSGLGNHKSGSAPPTPTLNGSVSGTTTADPNGTTCLVEPTFTLNNIPTDDDTHEIIFYKRTTGAADWRECHTTKIPGLPQPSTSLTFGTSPRLQLHHLPTGITIDVACAYRGHNLESPKLTLLSAYTVAPGTIGNTMLAAMPSSIKTNGPSITAASATRTPKKGTLHEFSVTATENDFGSLSSANWLDAVQIVIRMNGSTSHTHEVHVRLSDISFSAGAGSFTKSIHGALGQAHDIGFRYKDKTGDWSAITWPATVSNQTDTNGDFENTSTGQMTRSRHDASITNVIDANSNILNNLFGNASGVKISQNGEMTGFASYGSGGTSTQQSFALASGQPFSVHMAYQANATPCTADLVIGNTTNGYRLQYEATPAVNLYKVVGGVTTFLATVVSLSAQDTNPHSLRLTVKPGASTNTIEASFDGTAISITNNALTLTTGTWAVTVGLGSTSDKVTHFSISGAQQHHTGMSGGVQASTDSSGNNLNVEWSGAKKDTGGRLQFPTGVRTPSNVAYTLTQGTPFSIDWHLQHGSATSDDMRVALGDDVSNAYFVNSSPGNSVVRLGKIVGGVTTVIHDIPWTPTTNPQHIKLTITPGASSNTIEISSDGNAAYTTTDTSLTLTSGTWPVTVFQALSTDRFWHFIVKASPNHHSRMSGPVQHDIGSTADANGTFLTEGILSAHHHRGSKSGDTSNLMDNDGINSHVVHTKHSLGVQGAIDSNSNILNVKIAGTKKNQSEHHTNFSTTGSVSQETHSLTASTPFHIKARKKLAAGGQDHGVILGTQTSGYGLRWNGTTNSIDIGKWAGGSFTVMKNVATLTQDTNFHSWQLTVVPGASTHTIQGSIDGKSASTTDGTLALTTGTWNHTLHGPATMEAVDIIAQAAAPHLYALDQGVQQGAVLGYNKNLIPDSGFQLGAIDVATHAVPLPSAFVPHWSSSNLGQYPYAPWFVDSFFAAGHPTGGWSVGAGGAGGASCMTYNITGYTPPQSATATSAPLLLNPGTYTISCYIDATGITSGSASIGIFAWSSSGLGSGMGTLAQVNGQAGRVYATLTVTSAVSCVALLQVNGITATGNVVFSEPQLEIGSLLTAYEESIMGAMVFPTLPFTAAPLAVREAIDFSGKLLFAPFTNSSFTSDGAITLTSTAGTTNTSFAIGPTFKVVLSGWLANGSAGSVGVGIGIGIQGSNEYFLDWQSSGVVILGKIIGGVTTTLATLTTIAQDTNAHWYSLAVTYGSPVGTSDTVEAWFGATHFAPTAETGPTSAQYGGVVNAIAFGDIGTKLTNYHFGSNND